MGFCSGESLPRPTGLLNNASSVRTTGKTYGLGINRSGKNVVRPLVDPSTISPVGLCHVPCRPYGFRRLPGKPSDSVKLRNVLVLGRNRLSPSSVASQRSPSPSSTMARTELLASPSFREMLVNVPRVRSSSLRPLDVATHSLPCLFS